MRLLISFMVFAAVLGASSIFTMCCSVEEEKPTKIFLSISNQSEEDICFWCDWASLDGSWPILIKAHQSERFSVFVYEPYDLAKESFDFFFYQPTILDFKNQEIHFYPYNERYNNLQIAYAFYNYNYLIQNHYTVYYPSTPN